MEHNESAPKQEQPAGATGGPKEGETKSEDRSAQPERGNKPSEEGARMRREGRPGPKSENTARSDANTGADRSVSEPVSRVSGRADSASGKKFRGEDRSEVPAQEPDRMRTESDSNERKPMAEKDASEERSSGSERRRTGSDRMQTGSGGHERKPVSAKGAADAAKTERTEKQSAGRSRRPSGGQDARARLSEASNRGGEPHRREAAGKSKAAASEQRGGARNEQGRPQEKGRLLSRWTWRDYTLQLSVVILGVMVTFVGAGLIDRWREARQVRATMHLILQELDYNRSQVAFVCEKLRYDRQGMRMFDRYGMDVDRVPADSLKRYMLLLGAMRSPAFQTDALEVLKTSGVIQAVGDKELLMHVLGCYRELNSFAENVTLYNKRKLEAMEHFYAGGSAKGYDASDPREAWRLMLADPLCESFITTSASFFGNGDESFFDRAVARVEDAAAAVRDQYGFAYDDTMH